MDKEERATTTSSKEGTTKRTSLTEEGTTRRTSLMEDTTKTTEGLKDNEWMKARYLASQVTTISTRILRNLWLHVVQTQKTPKSSV